MKIAWDICDELINDIAEFDEVLDHILGLRFPHDNPPIITLYRAETDRWPDIEFGITGKHAFLYWTPQHQYAYDDTAIPAGPATFYTDPDRSQVIQPRCLRLGPANAREAAREYFTAGVRPACVRWNR